MSLGKPCGIFDLLDSDHNVGSFIKKQDVMRILDVDETCLSEIKFLINEGHQVVDEYELQKIWSKGQIPNAPKQREGNIKISMDELILKHLIGLAYPSAEVSHQFPWGRKRIDFYVKNSKSELFIEFYGPGHFINMYPTTNFDHPFKRKEDIEKEFQIECIIWPYWIQRYTRNVTALFQNHEGLGALWSTNVHFGMFPFIDSADIIHILTDRFNARRSCSLGYFYELNSENRIKPAHPVIEEILKGKKNINLLLPKGYQEKKQWFPQSLTAKEQLVI